MNATSTDEDMLLRLKRIESKLVRGFESIGVDTYDSADWLSVDDPHSTIYVSTMGRSLQVINDAAKKQGAKVGRPYEVVWRGDVKAVMTIW